MRISEVPPCLKLKTRIHSLSAPRTHFQLPHSSHAFNPEELTASAANASGSHLHTKLFRGQQPQSWWVSTPPSPPAQCICIHLPFPPTLNSLSLPSPLWTREQQPSTISSLPPLSTQAKDGNFQVSCLPSQYGKDDGVQFQPTSAVYFERAYLATWLAQISKVLHNTELREYCSVTGIYSAPSSSWLQRSLTMFNYLALFMAIYMYIYPQDNKHCNSACNKKIQLIALDSDSVAHCHQRKHLLPKGGRGKKNKFSAQHFYTSGWPWLAMLWENRLAPWGRYFLYHI